MRRSGKVTQELILRNRDLDENTPISLEKTLHQEARGPAPDAFNHDGPHFGLGRDTNCQELRARIDI